MATNKPADGAISDDQQLINKALTIITGKWRLSIILSLGVETLRYGELRDRLPVITEKVLADELKSLLLLDVVSRTAFAEVPPRVEYTLSKRGLLALPVLIQLKEVGRIFLQAPDPPTND